MGVDLLGLVSKIKSMKISGAKVIKIPKFFVSIWIGAILIVWLMSSFANMTVAEIPWSVLVFVAILLGADIALNFEGDDAEESNKNITGQGSQQSINSVDPVLLNQQPKGEKD